MTQLEFNFGNSPEPKLGQPLYPQPPKYTECSECWQKIGHFGFFESNEMEGHVCVCLKIIKNSELMPEFVDGLWRWVKISDGLKKARLWYSPVF